MNYYIYKKIYLHIKYLREFILLLMLSNIIVITIISIKG